MLILHFITVTPPHDLSCKGKRTAIVKRVLKINDIHDLKSAKKHYRILFKRYFKVPEIDKKKVLEIASEYYSGIREVHKIGKGINSYPKLKNWLNQIKDDISRKNYSKRYRLRDIEKKILLKKDNFYFV